MLTRADIARLLTSGLKTQFMAGMKGIEPVYTKFTTEIASTKNLETYAWLGAVPQLKEWKDERAPKALIENGFTIVNKDYEASISVDRNALDDDQYGQIKLRVRQLGMTVVKGYDRLAAEAVEAGTTELAYDGQNFFDTDHTEGENVTNQSNLLSALPLNGTNAKTVITAMRQFKDDRNEFSGANPTHIMVPSGLEFTAMEIFNPQFVNVTDQPGDRSLSGVLKVIVNPYLTNQADWYVLDLSQGVSPFIFQNRKAPQLASLDKPDSEANFFRKELFYGVDARFNFGYGDWRGAIKAVAV